MLLHCTGQDNIDTDHQIDIAFDIEINIKKSTAKMLAVFGFSGPKDVPALLAKITDRDISGENKDDNVIIRYYIDRYSGKISFTADYLSEKNKREYGEGVCEKVEIKKFENRKL